ncbi:hypothetical protein [Pseudomonas sp. AA-38]|uniref:hypothetical protein n=1 Tax=Pseudomonas sp. AA-38 TaxID=3028807 RepID=UPI0023FA0735|nr:hypothetical protein [Pseudomonas sp. AA-38]
MPNPDSFYSPEAYHPERIPNQPPAEKQPWLRRFGSMRLPWGSTQDMVPIRVLNHFQPSELRAEEAMKKDKAEQLGKGTYVPKLLEHLDLHARLDNEKIRHAQLPASSKIWIYMQIIGKWGAIILAPFVFLSCFIGINFEKTDWWRFFLDALLEMYMFFCLPLLISWGLGSLVINHFPKLWIKPSRGALWEFNRRTGLVTVFDYDNNGEYKKNGTIGEKVAPFYEFDAYITVTPDRQGLPNNVLCIVHRYRDIWINMGNFVGASNSTSVPCALWDYLQNYMDISKPLPDTPELEAFRHLDPTTAEHDRQTGREPRYWRDMDDETFKAKERELDERIPQIDTFSRPNLMALHVSYAD